MFSSSRFKRRENVDLWPAFVDSLATVLMVLVFVLVTFFVAQLYLTDMLSGRNKDLDTLQKVLAKTKIDLTAQTQKRDELDRKGKDMDCLIKDLRAKLSETVVLHREALDGKTKALEEKGDLEKKLSVLSLDHQQLLILKQQLEGSVKKAETDLNLSNEEATKLRQQIESFSSEYATFLNEKRIDGFRSEFFGKLRQILGNRDDFRIVDDRFVFQSEVLFSLGSADLGPEGSANLDYLATVLKEITSQIPQDVPWVLRIDGHTDNLPIKTGKYPSNWELSIARAVAVVRYLVEKKGIEPSRLVAAGFGEHHPLVVNTEDNKELAKNRRIAFKLDQY